MLVHNLLPILKSSLKKDIIKITWKKMKKFNKSFNYQIKYNKLKF